MVVGAPKQGNLESDCMNWKSILLLYAIGLSILIGIAAFQDSPGYMDAEYYASIARRISEGEGFTEPFVWNYLGEEKSLPQTAFQYWKPLPSLTAAASMLIFRSSSFRGARGLFVFAASFAPVLTALYSYQLTGDQKKSILSGLFACFPAFYLPFLTTTDSFALYLLGGGLIFFFLNQEFSTLNVLLIGIVSGLMGLTRAEGLIWVVISGLGIIFRGKKFQRNFILLSVGFLCVWLPWLTIQQLAIENQGSSSGLKTLWLTSYNQLYSFQTDALNLRTWLESGLSSILKARGLAVWKNIQTLLVVQGQIILAPFSVVGFVHYRKKSSVRAGLLGLAATFIIMSVLFPFSGQRGGYFHAGAGFQILFWVMSASGFSIILSGTKRKFEWDDPKAFNIFGAGVIIILAAVCLYTAINRLGLSENNQPSWNQAYARHEMIDVELSKIGLGKEDLVMINNPPGLYYATDRWSVVIPDGDIDQLLKVSDEFGVRYLVLEKNHPENLNELYEQPSSTGRLNYLSTSDGAHFFEIKPEL